MPILSLGAGLLCTHRLNMAIMKECLSPSSTAFSQPAPAA